MNISSIETKRMNEIYTPSKVYAKNRRYGFIVDIDFMKNSTKALKPFLKKRSFNIRQCVTDGERIFAYIVDDKNHNYRSLVEMDNNGKFVNELEEFSRLEDFEYGTIAVNDSFIAIEDFRGPPNLYIGGLGPKYEQFINEIKLYLFSRDNGNLVESGNLKYSVSNLTFDNKGRLFGMCNKLYGEWGDILRIVELKRKKNGKNLEGVLDDSPLKTKWTMNKLYKIKNWQSSPLIKTPEGEVLHYNSQKNKAYWIKNNKKGKLDSHEERNNLRSANRFVFLDDFIVCLIHEYRGKRPPYKNKLIFKGETYEKNPQHFFYETPVFNNSVGWVFEPLNNNSFIVNVGHDTLTKFRIESI